MHVCAIIHFYAQAVLNGEKGSQYMKGFESRPKFLAPTYFCDEDQSMRLYTYVSRLLDIEFVCNVLCPEVSSSPLKSYISQGIH